MTEKTKRGEREPIPYFRQRAWLTGITFVLFVGWAALMIFVPHPTDDISGDTWSLWRNAETTHFGLLVWKVRLLWTLPLGTPIVLIIILFSLLLRRGITVAALTLVGAAILAWLSAYVPLLLWGWIFVGMTVIGLIGRELAVAGWRHARRELAVIGIAVVGLVGSIIITLITIQSGFDALTLHQTDMIESDEGTYRLFVTYNLFTITATVFDCENGQANCALLGGTQHNDYPPGRRNGQPAITTLSVDDATVTLAITGGSQDDQTIVIDRATQ